MTKPQCKRRQVQACCAMLLVFSLARWPTAASASSERGVPQLPVLADALGTTANVAPGWGGDIHRLVTRLDHSLRRLGTTFGRVGGFWLSAVVSSIIFLVVAALSSVADWRIFDLRQYGPGAMSRYLAYGVRTFFRILRDGRTPYSARLVLAAALIYWLLPLDIVSDASVVPGFVDDVVIAVVASKAFIYLCPDSLVVAHAAAVEQRTQVEAAA